MRTRLLFFLLLTISATSYSQNKSEYELFKNDFLPYFGDGKALTKISKQSYNEFLFTNNECNEDVYALGKVENYKGMDLFFVHTECSYEGYDDVMSEETSYTNLYIFKDGKRYVSYMGRNFINYRGYDLSDGMNDCLECDYIRDEDMIYGLYYGLEADTTFTFSMANIARGDLSDLSMAFDKRYDVNCVLNDDFTFSVVGVQGIELEAPIFNYEISEEDWWSDVPTEDAPYNVFEDDAYTDISHFFPDCELEFYVSSDNVRTFKLVHKGKAISTYEIGKKLPFKMLQPQGNILEYSLCIKTQDGNVEMDRNGSFWLRSDNGE